MRFSSMLIVALLFSRAAFGAEPAPADLTGTWKLTSQQSKQQLTRSGIATLTIARESTRFVFTDVAEYADGHTNESYSVTPGETEQAIPTGSISARWKGKVLVVRQRSSAGDLTETWRLKRTSTPGGMVRAVVAIEHVRGKDILVFKREERYLKQ
jgi:hypothetical protein